MLISNPAPKGRKQIARGVSPGKYSRNISKPREGRQNLASFLSPLRGSAAPRAAEVPLLTLLDSRLPDVGETPGANNVKGGSFQMGEEFSDRRRRVVYGPPPLAFHAPHGQALKDLPTPLIDVRGCS